MDGKRMSDQREESGKREAAVEAERMPHYLDHDSRTECPRDMRGEGSRR